MPDRDVTQLVKASRDLIVRLLVKDRTLAADPEVARSIDAVFDAVAAVETMGQEQRTGEAVV